MKSHGGKRKNSGRKRTLFDKVRKSFVICQSHVREISRQKAIRNTKSSSEVLRSIIDEHARHIDLVAEK